MKNVQLASIALATFAALVGGSSCQQVPKLPGSSVDVLAGGGPLLTLSPADVVVAPIEVLVTTDSPPLNTLLRSFQEALVDRRYSPLSTEYVEGGTIEASYTPGAFEEQAVLQISVRGWSEDLGMAHTNLLVDVEATMLDPTLSGEDAVLWRGRLSKRYAMALESISSRNQIRSKVCHRIADELLAAMPARRTQP